MTTNGGNPSADNQNSVTAVLGGPGTSAREIVLRPGHGRVEFNSPAARN